MWIVPMANSVALKSTISHERMELKSESYDPELVSDSLPSNFDHILKAEAFPLLHKLNETKIFSTLYANSQH